MVERVSEQKRQEQSIISVGLLAPGRLWESRQCKGIVCGVSQCTQHLSPSRPVAMSWRDCDKIKNRVIFIFPIWCLWSNRKTRTLKKTLLLYILLSKPRLLERKTTLLKVQRRMHEVNPYYAKEIQKGRGDRCDDSNRVGGGWNNYCLPRSGVSTQETPSSLCKSGYFLETEPRGWWTRASPASCAPQSQRRELWECKVVSERKEGYPKFSTGSDVPCRSQHLDPAAEQKQLGYPTGKTANHTVSFWQFRSQLRALQNEALCSDISSFFTLKLLTLLVYESLIGKLFNSRDHD